jgi:glutamate synthase domain-containing protein 3
MKNIIDAKGMNTREINITIKKVIEKNNSNDKFYYENISNNSNIAVGLNENIRIFIENDVGDLVGALNNGATITVKGRADRYVADGMTAGEVIIYGDTAEGAGTGMCGGTLVIRGNSGNTLGQLLKGGTIVVGGNVGDLVGSFMITGIIIIGGNAGKQLGSSMIGGVIYIRGSYESLGNNVKKTSPSEEEILYLKMLFIKYQLDIDPNMFEKIVTIENMFR